VSRALLLLVMVGLVPLAKADACETTHFETELVRQACERGGKSAARFAMSVFQKKAKQQRSGLDCKSCHSTMSPSYTLKPTALEQYRALGGT
jgi:hypothetical protein